MNNAQTNFMCSACEQRSYNTNSWVAALEHLEKVWRFCDHVRSSINGFHRVITNTNFAVWTELKFKQQIENAFFTHQQILGHDCQETSQKGVISKVKGNVSVLFWQEEWARLAKLWCEAQSQRKVLALALHQSSVSSLTRDSCSQGVSSTSTS